MLQYQLNMIERESKYKDSKLIFKNKKLIKKFRRLSILSTKTLIQNLFCSYIKSFDTAKNLKINTICLMCNIASTS